VIDDDNEVLNAILFENAGNAALADSNHGVAVIFFKQALATFTRLDDKPHVGRVAFSIARALIEQGQRRQAVRYLETSSEAFEVAGDAYQTRSAECCLALAELLILEGQAVAAVNAFEKTNALSNGHDQNIAECAQTYLRRLKNLFGHERLA
jgi:hypothetical protein